MSEFGPNVEEVNLPLISHRLEVFEMIWKDYKIRNSSVAPVTLGIVYKLAKFGIVGGDVEGSKLLDETARKAIMVGYSRTERTGITQRVKGLIWHTDFYSTLPQRSLRRLFADSVGEAVLES